MSDNRWVAYYRATVQNNADPENLGRVQLVIPSVLGPNAVSNWAWPMSPGGSIPALSSRVTVAFENGDPNNPVYFAHGVSAPATLATSGLGSLSLSGNASAAVDPLGTAAATKIWAPSDSGLLAASSDPQYIPGGNLLSGGVIQLIQLVFPSGGTVANLLYGVLSAGVALTTAQCWIGLYNAAGTLISNAVDQTTNFGVTNDHTVPITVRAGQSLLIPIGGVAYVALLSNATTTQVAIWSPGTQSTAANINLAAGAYRYCQSGTTQTALPTSITLSAATRTRAYFAAAS